MEIRASGSTASRRAPADYFSGTGTGYVRGRSAGAGNVRASLVHFEAGRARPPGTAGRRLSYPLGVGRVQSAGGPVREVRAGDVASCPARSIGTAPARPPPCRMAITKMSDGKYVAWMEKSCR